MKLTSNYHNAIRFFFFHFKYKRNKRKEEDTKASDYPWNLSFLNYKFNSLKLLLTPSGYRKIFCVFSCSIISVYHFIWELRYRPKELFYFPLLRTRNYGEYKVQTVLYSKVIVILKEQTFNIEGESWFATEFKQGKSWRGVERGSVTERIGRCYMGDPSPSVKLKKLTRPEFKRLQVLDVPFFNKKLNKGSGFVFFLLNFSTS